jgi:triosephosphate isomerase
MDEQAVWTDEQKEKQLRQLVAGNWKMNGLSADLAELEALKQGLAAKPAVCDVLVCPPASLLARAASAAKRAFDVGGQDCRPEPAGAFTGDVSAEMLKDAGASAVIVGHSERRQYHGERDVVVAAKARAAWRAGLMAIICIGETEDQRDAGKAHHICGGQITGSVPPEATPENIAIAYEPVWAIGTGRTPSDDDIVAMHAHIRNCTVEHLGAIGRKVRILYGGSVKPSNAKAILSLDDVNGALVGGASLKAQDFLAIIAASASR